MKTNYLILAAAVLAIAACNKQEAPAPAELSAPAAISFDGYLNRGVATRSGAAGLMDATLLQAQGFGVFGYYTDFNAYDDRPPRTSCTTRKSPTTAATGSTLP